MAFNGAGTFNRPVSDYVYDTVISETDMNTEMDGIATGLSTCITKDGQTTVTANLPMATYRHTGVGNASARTDYAAAGQVQDSAFIWGGTAGGTKNALTLTPAPAITAYAAGQIFYFISGGTQSDDAVTIAVSGLTTKAGQINGAACSATNYIEASKLYMALYDGTQFQLTRLSLNALAKALTRGYALAGDANGLAAAVDISANGNALVGDGTDAVATGIIKQGVHTEYYDASAFQPTVSNGCAALAQLETTAGRPDINYLAFDGSADEHAQIAVVPPKKWNGGTVTFRVYHTHPSAITTGVAWALQGVAIANDGTIDVAYGTAVVVTDTYLNAAEDLHITATSAAVTIAGSPAGGGDEFVVFRLFRDVSDAADDTATDAYFLGMDINWTINAGDDS